ncbi:aromatic-ring-hydroxylating dioxygenase subunit beta [Sphingomonas sp. BAUL-RG-20F-R05-02]|uniref:aromatic-ring-hydroxylating dioxygenase subunit beta n=1 Tax=Sphingomonas sp. BAUL-RG-20F-R05-02 TaxID=2914830 RepID=UPI001F59C691|nr:3-phenylpropionate/cinnamic acid dioxygenase subunit beta [Sphingomonas sp. BAUL-RG-20F-R05-02]
MTSSDAAVAEAETPARARILMGTTLYGRIAEAYFEEAATLDALRYAEWVGWLAEDVRYTCPQRMTRSLKDWDKSIDRRVMHFDENHKTLSARVRRLHGNSAFAEDPPSRTRRLITNIRVLEGEDEGSYAVTSYFLLTRSRFENATLMLMSGERRDVIRDLGERFELASREIILDQAVLGMPNLAVFL